MTINTPLSPEDLCIKLPDIPDSIPGISFIGGAVIQSHVSFTKVPSFCSLTESLSGQLSSALTPLQPLLNILDFVTTLAQCTLLIPKAITNPFKVGEVIQCMGDVIAKLNGLLALVPIFPTGARAWITTVADVIRLAAFQIQCVADVLNSLLEQLNRINSTIAAAGRLPESAQKQRLLTFANCATVETGKSVKGLVAALAPVARIVCTIRAILMLVPGGKEIAKNIAFPSLSAPEAQGDVGEFIQKVEAFRDSLQEAADILLGTLEVLAALVLPFGGLIPQPSLTFECPLDVAPELFAVAPQPAISGISPDLFIARLPGAGTRIPVVLDGQGFVQGVSVVSMDSRILSDDQVDFFEEDGRTKIRVLLLAEDVEALPSPGPAPPYQRVFQVSNPPATPETDTGPADGGSSNTKAVTITP